MAEGSFLHHHPVTIVGGGIAGLTAAIALAQRGAVVTVHERASAFREVGAGIQVSPNAGRVLEALGLGEVLDPISIRSQAVELCNVAGRPVARLDLARRRPGETFRFVHRARLLALLETSARAVGVDIRLGDHVEDMPDAGLLIGADGLRSAQRAALNPGEQPFFTGQVAWRALIPLEARAAPVAKLFMGPGRHLVSYPLGEGLRNIIAVIEEPEWTAEDWAQEGDPATMRAAFAAFGGPVPDWLAEVERCGKWGLFRHRVAPRWQDGRRVLIGDAAHPTLPFVAQGACMAIEDAWRLAYWLDSAPQEAALIAFEEERRPRAERIVAAANANARNYHLTGMHRIAAHTALRAINAVAPNLLINRYAWIWDYDPVTA